MNSAPQRFKYQRSAAGAFAILPLELKVNATMLVDGLLDTGASISVLPFSLGLKLGADWQKAIVFPPLGGNLAGVETRGIIVSATVASFAAIDILFGWTKTDSTKVLLGQTNFLEEFDVCFFGSKGEFEIAPRV